VHRRTLASTLIPAALLALLGAAIATAELSAAPVLAESSTR
jgi:hypothetical protein